MSARRSVSCARARLSEPSDYGQPFGCLFLCSLALMQALRADRLACCLSRKATDTGSATCRHCILPLRRPHAGFGACAASLPRFLELYSRVKEPARPRADAADRLRRFLASLGNALGERKCEPLRPRAAFGACPPPKQGRELGGHNRNLSTRECRGFAPLELFHDISISHQRVLWGINLSTALSAILCI